MVDKSGSWYAYNGDKIGQGRENAKTFLREHPELMEDIENRVRQEFNLPVSNITMDSVNAVEKPEKGKKSKEKADRASAKASAEAAAPTEEKPAE